MSMNTPKFDDAAMIIEKFGGIRPMSSKTDIPVTTIQGWKKRGAIPKGRRDEILSFAVQNDIDLTGSLNLKDTPAKPSLKAQKRDAAANENATVNVNKADESATVSHVPSSVRTLEETSQATIEKAMKSMERKITLRSVLMSALFALGAVGFMVFLFNPTTQPNGAADQTRILELEQKIAELESKQAASGGILPENIGRQLTEMQDQIILAAEKLQDGSGGFLQNGLDELQTRVGFLEDAVDGLNVPIQKQQMGAWLVQLQNLKNSGEGRAKIKAAVQDLSSVFSDVDSQALDSDRLDGVLDGARAQSSALGETLNEVPVQDLKAAAMLLAMTQFRSSLNRDNQPFNDDLIVLKSLVSEDNIELQDALEKLAPHARNGVLTPSGLTGEFKTLSGEIVVASLQGDDVSVTERTTARINKLFQIEKDGELITGTPTQATLKSAENKLESNDISGALLDLGKLEGPAAAAIRPWIAKAKATMVAQRIKIILK